MIGNDTPIDFGVWVEKVKAIKTGKQKIVHDDEEKTPPAPATEVPPTVVQETPEMPIGEAMGTIADETIAEMAKSLTDEDGEDAGDPTVYRLSAPKVKEVNATWKKYAEHNGWNTADSDRKKKATLKKYYDVEEPKDLTIEQADDLVGKITSALQKPAPETK